jgi:NADH:ubiquinone oxidoreductase subunit F (NADH-binding)
MTMTLSLPRVLHGASGRPLTLREHREVFGAVPQSALFDELEASGLAGRGGGGFTTARKVDFVRRARGRRKVVVVNAMEGEPMGHKDRTLLSTNPHLLLDGAEYLASMIGAQHVDVCVSRNDPAIVHHVQRALN